MRRRRSRGLIEKPTTAKLERVTVRMLRALYGDFITIDNAIWRLADTARKFFDVTVTAKGLPDGLDRAAAEKKYGIPGDREVYRPDPVSIPAPAPIGGIPKRRGHPRSPAGSGIPSRPRDRCKVCGAPPGKPCITLGRKTPRSEPHAGRR